MDISLNFVHKGEGEVLILLHGNGENCTYFENQIDCFARYFSVYALDTRGHGGSPRGTKPFTLAQFAEDLRGFMDENKIQKAHILGFSDGGNIAMLFALKYPERVNKLILNGANTKPSGMKLWCVADVYFEWLLWTAVSKLRRSESAAKKSALFSLMAFEPDIEAAQLAKLSMPTLVIAGTHDMIKTSHTKQIHRQISGSELALIDGDHFIASNQSEKFNETVLSFLENPIYNYGGQT